MSLLCLAVAAMLPAHAQTTTSPTYYYCIERLSDGLVVRRGTARSQGIPQNGLILGPNTPYRFWMLEAHTGLTGFTEFVTPDNGFQFTIPNISLSRSLAPDFDGDGLRDDAEFVAGTDPTKQDTDLDGLKDFVEMKQGLDPLDGLNVRTGVLGGTDTPGTAVDVCAINDIAIVADGTNGVSVFNIFNRMPPLLIGQVQTPGNAQRVACSGNLIAAATGSNGLAVIDISAPPNLRILRQVAVGGSAQAVTAGAGVAYVGTDSNEVVAVEMLSGVILQRFAVDGPVMDLALGREAIHVVTRDTFYSLSVLGGIMHAAGSVSYFGTLLGAGSPVRLFVGPDRAYVNDSRGVFVFDLSAPLIPQMLRYHLTAQSGWRQIVLNGGGLGIGAVGANTLDNLPNDAISLFDLRPGGTNLTLLTGHLTPGTPRAISIYNGLAYVADADAGLQVLNYLAYDNGTNPPTVSLSASFPLSPGLAEEGKAARVTAEVTDDVQARSVEFYVDGQRILIEGSYPFEARFVTPKRTASKTSFTLRARAFDTGGNSTWTEQLVVTLTNDFTPPQLLRTIPANESALAVVEAVAGYFDEPLSSNSVTAATFRLDAAGPDGVIGTGDDVVVTNGIRSVESEQTAVFMRFAPPLGAGLYQASVLPPLGNVAELALTNSLTWRFRVLPTTTVRGVVVGPDGQPVAGATVVVFDSGQGAVVTDAQGRFEINSVVVIAPTVFISVHAVVGGLSLSLNVQVTAVPGGETILGNLTLQPRPVETHRLAAGLQHVMAMQTNGTLWGWGGNDGGQLGIGTFLGHSILEEPPQAIGTNSNWRSIAAGFSHTIGLRADGSLWTWGGNQYGQLGDGSLINRAQPVRVGTNATWHSVAAGGAHTVAIRDDGTLWSWGFNDVGQLGDGTLTRRVIAVQVGTNSNWRVAAAGLGRTTAVRGDGTLWTWGVENFAGFSFGVGGTITLFGTGTTNTLPEQLGTGNNWSTVAAGLVHVVGLREDGTLWAWGGNSRGQLGNGTFTSRTQPVQVGTNATWQSVAAGREHTLALRADGTLWAWGSNQAGQLGVGPSGDSSQPVQIGTNTNWHSVAAGWDNTVATRTDGTLWHWGNIYFPEEFGFPSPTPDRYDTSNSW